MKVTINQLDEEVNAKNADVTIQQLKKENSQLHQLVNKYRESKNVNRISVGPPTEKVDSIMMTVSNVYIASCEPKLINQTVKWLFYINTVDQFEI